MKFKILLILALYGCFSSEKTQPEKLCKDFCALNNNAKFSTLFEVSTDTRFANGRPTYIGVYCSEIKGNYINIPTNTNDFKTRHLYKSEEFYKCKHRKEDDIDFYKQYISNFEREYNMIKVPNYYHNNIVSDGNPKLGRFIKFTLNDECNVYYLENFKTLSPYWRSKFKRLYKFNERWYYEYDQQ